MDAYAQPDAPDESTVNTGKPHETRRGTKGNRSEQWKRYAAKNASKRREYLKRYMKARRSALLTSEQ